jgi:hypothetical protein
MSQPTDLFPTTKSLIEKVKELYAPANEPMPFDQFDNDIKALIRLSIEHSQKNSHNVATTLDQLNEVGNGMNQRYIKLCDAYRFSNTRYIDVTNLITQHDESEKRAHLRNLFYRTLTTLCVGLAIMGVYALAHCLGIPMPLMRLPTPS